MLQTIFGNLLIRINEVEYEYSFKELSNSLKGGQVEKRYILLVKDFLKKQSCNLEITLSSNELLPNINVESGENLFAVSFTDKVKNLCIGVEGDVPGIDYQTSNSGIILNISPESSINDIRIAVAWMRITEPSDAILTWLAADPNYQG